MDSNLEYEPQSRSPVEDDVSDLDLIRWDADVEPSSMQKRLFILRGKRLPSGMRSTRPFILRGKRLFIMRGNRPVYQKRVELDDGPEWEDSQDYQEEIRWNRGFANGNWI